MAMAPDRGWGVVLLMNESSFFWFSRQDLLGLNVMRMLLNQPVPAAPGPTDTYLILGFLLVILMVTAGLSTHKADIWLQDPDSRPSRSRQVIYQQVLPMLVFLGIAYLVGVNLIQVVFNGLPFHLIMFTHPDIAWIILITVPLALLFTFTWLAVLVRIYLLDHFHLLIHRSQRLFR
jgi:hypothetical protein